ncbi:hypothetical protein AMR41_29500 [Hapalosiphon sp. MRB220]|nr:hypothetical protein AMR41_29500 [Hapalosiphon sp. MRB220]
MSTLPDSVTIKAGDSLNKIASEVLGDYSDWRSIATLNKIDIFSVLEVGKQINIPSRDKAEKWFRDTLSTEISEVNSEIQNRVNEIINSREGQVITKFLGISNEKLLKDLDLSPLLKGLSTISTGELNKALGSLYDSEIPEYRLISWVL